MKIVEPYIEVPEIDGVSIMKNIERIGRTCYKSEVKSDDSYKKFIQNLIKRGHESVIEHEKISIRFVTDRGAMWDITRHRHASFSIESSRYCNYNNGRFGGEIKVIEPFFLKGSDEAYSTWKNAMENAEKAYMKIIELGYPADAARMTVPASLATEINMTCNIREWRHVLKLRTAKGVHPSVRQIMVALLVHFKTKMPELFEDIPVPESDDFDPQNYAKIKVVK